MKGSCHCGLIQFETTARPYWVGACYCVDCRKISSAPYLVYAGFKAGEVTVTSGEPKYYRSSEKVRRSFCAECSSHISFIYDTNPDEHFIPVGIFDTPEILAPQEHIYISQKLPWLVITDDFEQTP